MQETILLIEGDMEFSSYASENLRQEGFKVICAYDGDEGIKLFEENSIDIILIDIVFSKKDGISTLKKIVKKSNVPVIMITSISNRNFQSMCLSLDVKDFILKPCHPGFLVKKIRTILREKREISTFNEGEWVYKNVKVNFSKNFVVKDGDKIIIGKKQMEMLRILVYNKGSIITRDQFIEYIWGIETEVNDRTVDSHISKLKRNLELDCIKSVSGYGYKLET